MATRWVDYKNRRGLQLLKWADNLGLRTYEDIFKHLKGAGILPPMQDHPDIALIISQHARDESKTEPVKELQTSKLPAKKVKEKPDKPPATKVQTRRRRTRKTSSKKSLSGS